MIGKNGVKGDDEGCHLVRVAGRKPLPGPFGRHPPDETATSCCGASTIERNRLETSRAGGFPDVAGRRWAALDAAHAGEST